MYKGSCKKLDAVSLLLRQYDLFYHGCSSDTSVLYHQTLRQGHHKL